MSWNRPDVKQQPLQPKTRHTYMRVLLALILGASVTIFFLMFEKTNLMKSNSIQSTPGRVKTQGGRFASRYVAKSEAVKTSGVAKPELQTASAVLQAEKKGRVVTFTRPANRIFDNDAEDFIMGIVTSIPGERFIEVPLDENFDRLFQESLTNRIVITDKDTAEIADVKRAVIAAKEEVLAETKEGRLPHEVIENVRAELNKIADYRDQLQKACDQLALNAKTPKEILEYTEEANRLLKEYGAFPIEGATTEEEALELQQMLIANKLQEEEDKDKKEAKK